MPEAFRGAIGRWWYESTPWWPEPRRARAGSPNVVVVVLDDVGFAQLGCFGGSIDTPVLDRLAGEGLRYTNFHTTALCSPTRACVLTGRNHHSNAMGRIVELPLGFPGYYGHIPRENGFLSQMLLEQGYATFAVGKWHLTPEEEQHLAAPRTNWPLGRGFERFYGFFGGETHQFAPTLVYDNHQVAPPRRYDEGYHLTEDLVDRAIEFVADLRAIDAEKPFFLYFCPGACHAPHQAPREWIDRYRGAFDHGWDEERERILARQMAAGVLPPGTELSPRPEWVPAWDDLTSDQRRVSARYMEAFAGFLSHTDHHLGRLISFLDETGDLDATLLFVLSDNGASSEGGRNGSVNFAHLHNGTYMRLAEVLRRLDDIGGPRFHNNYPWGWTVAGNTPFRRWKREVHEGGVADPLIVRWPRAVPDPGGFRRQYVHAIDIVPTVCEVLGVEPPATLGGVPQRPIEGVSFAPTLGDPDAPDAHQTQYYEMFGCRAIYHQGWKAVTYHPIHASEPRFEDDAWELYDLRNDPTECHDLAAERPEKLQELIERWWAEAARYNVLPIDNRPFGASTQGRPWPIPSRRRYVYYPSGAMVPEWVAADVKNRNHIVTAEVVLGDEPVEGVLVAQGSLLGGWSLYVKGGLLRYVHNFGGMEEHRVDAPFRAGPGRHTVEFRFERTGDHAGLGRLLLDGVVIGEGGIPRFTPAMFCPAGIGLTCGRDDLLPVTDDYEAPFRFSAHLERVVIEVDGEPHVDPVARAEIAIARQ
jgi:arylsulfatase A-like enzyme